MDAVIMCCDWDPDPPNMLESHKVTFYALNYIYVYIYILQLGYIMAINKLEAVWLTHRDRGCFLKSEVSVWKADHHSDLFSTQTILELKFFAGDRHCFSGRNVTVSCKDRREDRHEDGRFSMYSCGIFFLISYQRQLQLLRYFCLVM